VRDRRPPDQRRTQASRHLVTDLRPIAAISSPGARHDAVSNHDLRPFALHFKPPVQRRCRLILINPPAVRFLRTAKMG